MKTSLHIILAIIAGFTTSATVEASTSLTSKFTYNIMNVSDQNTLTAEKKDSVLIATSGTSSEKAIQLKPEIRFNKQEFIMTDTAIWFKFIADSANIRVFIENTSDTIDKIKSLSIYSGNCNNLVLIASQSNEYHTYVTDILFDTHNLSKGETYYIKVISNNLLSDELKISLQNINTSLTGNCTEPNSWSQVGNGFNYNVYNLKTIGSNLFAVGEFASSGGNLIDCVSKWSDSSSSWTSINAGMNNDARTLCDFNGELIVGGSFTQAGGLPTEKIAKWNGIDWLPLGVGISGSPVHSLCVYNDELYVGSAGKFNIGDGVIDYSIAKWDGSNWYEAGGGVVNNTPSDTRIFAMTVHNNDLYVGGIFQLAGTSTVVNNIAKWDGTDWFPLDMGVNGSVSSICEYNNELYIGGEFTQAGSNTVNYIAKWDELTNTWIALGNGTATRITSLCVYNNELYATGFDYNDMPWISKWDGNSWAYLCTGMNNQHVMVLYVHNNDLYAGGSFSEATGNQAQRIAKWCPPQPEAGNNTALCSGGSTQLIASGGGSFLWSSLPSDISLAGQMTSQNPTVSPTQTTTYTVTVTSSFGCTSTDDVVVSVNPSPTLFNLTGGGSYCVNDMGMSVTLSGSQPGVSFQLMKDGIDLGNVISGTGHALVWDNMTAGTYNVVAAYMASPYCSIVMNDSVIITESLSPEVFNLTGGGSYCAGGTGLSVMLSGSQSGVSFQLKKDSIDVGNVISGTGYTLVWNNMTAGTYTVVATYVASPYCSIVMNNSVTINESPVPVVFELTAGTEGTGFRIILSSSQFGVNYQLMKDGSDKGTAISGTGNALVWDNQIADTYTVVAAYTASSDCSVNMDEPITITGLQQPVSETGGFLVFPNPFTNIVMVSIVNTPTANAEIKTYDAIGKLVNSKVINDIGDGGGNITLDFSLLANGIYYISYISDGYFRNEKIIKQD